ncbi:hypothetical protein IH992_03505 [Candidatus Poribacteria bacterium]|nr:hypothetical protein [Candidatus Poribacteria bacterium]
MQDTRCKTQGARYKMQDTESLNPVSCIPDLFHVLRFTLYILCVSLLSTIAWAEPPLRIIHSDAGSLTFTFELPDPQFNTQEIQGRSFSQISFEDATLTMEIGRPRLPVYIQLIGIPVGTSPHASVTHIRSEIRSTQTIIPAQPDANQRFEGEFPQETGKPVIDADFYQQDRFQPLHLVEVVPIGFIRDQRVARLQIQPIQYNPARSLLKIYRQLQVRIDFNQPPRRIGLPAAPSLFVTRYQPSGPFEQLFQASVLNYEQAKAWRQSPQNQISAAPLAETGAEERYKILLDRTSIYEITYRSLRGIGADPDQIDLNTVKMESSGRRVGVWIFDQNSDGKFDPDDSIVFYGRSLNENRFTKDNVYWLIWGGAGNSRVNTLDAAPKTPNAPIPFAFKKSERFEQNWIHDRLESSDIKSELADHYFWTGLNGTNNPSNRNKEKNFVIQVPNAVPRAGIDRTAELRVKFQGATHKGSARHEARIRFNDRQLGRPVEWKRQAAPLVIRDIEQRRFIHHDAANILTIIANDQNNTPSTEFDFYVDWYELDYWHTFKASGSALEFNSDTEPRSVGTVRYRVTNLSRPEIDVYQIREGQIVAKLINGQIEKTNTNYQITFEDRITQPTNYFVVRRGSYRQVNRISKAPPFTLKNPANRADYIIISHRDFIKGVQPLAEFRQSQGLSTMIVDVEDIYNQFSHGIFNPLAIQKFLRYTFTSWQKPAPEYVLLVGDAHYDYKSAIVDVYRRDFKTDYNLYPIFVPTFHGWANNSGETAMDHRFVMISGNDPLPDMYIGRLSVQFPHELERMVKKIIGYEQNRQSGPWQHVLMQVADDDSDNVGDGIFEASRDFLIDEIIPVAYDTRKVYLKQIVSPERTKHLILETINEGVTILEYSGHGGVSTWADENIFRIEDAQGLRNQHLPFIITTTCLNGQFDQPLEFGQRSLSEQFLMGQYGAIGALSATRLTLATSNAEFDKDLFKSMFTVKPPTLGAIIGNAKINFLTRASVLSVSDVQQYTLFGDPATRLALPELEIQVELEETVLNVNKQIVIRQNIVGSREVSPITGELEFRKATDFITGKLSALALFPNDLDYDPTNDLPRREDNIQVWGGEFGDIRIEIPRGVDAGAGVVRLFAFNDQQSAVGGAKFWIDQPVIRDVREDMDAKVTNTLNLSVQIVDDIGAAGIQSVQVIWSDTVSFKEHTLLMIPHPSPPEPAVKGGQWYALQSPIPLPKGGKLVRYRVVVTDSSNHVVFFPSKTQKQSLKVPEGANIAIATGPIGVAPIRYAFSNELKAPTLTVELVNDGGREIDVDIEVWFSEGNPDRNGDSIIDPDADVFGSVLVRASEWEPGDTTLQKVTVILVLETPLSTGVHKVFVFADPETASDDHNDQIIGKLDEPRSYDNRRSRTFIVNEFQLKQNEELTAFSLDRVFDALFPVGAAEPTSLSVDTLEPLTSFQPNVDFAAIPRVAALRRGLARQGPTATQVYNIDLHSGAKTLIKSIDIKLRFDISALTDGVREKYGLRIGEDGFDTALKRETDRMAIYAWQEQIKAWKRLPSEILRDDSGDFRREEYVTLAQTENTNAQTLNVSDIRVDADLTPEGKWIVFFIDPERYEILLLRKGETKTEKLAQSGQLDKIFRDEILGIELNIPRSDSEYEFGDVMKFETNLEQDGNVRLSAVSNSNSGNGSAIVDVITNMDHGFEIGDWLIFFKNDRQFEIRDRLNELVRYQRGAIVQGGVNQPLFIKNLGIEVLVTSGDQGFEFGDKIKFSTATVGVISTKVRELKPFALMTTSDVESPKLQLWVNGEILERGSVIPPRPEISLFLEDTNGIDLDSFKFAVSKNDGPLEQITEFDIANTEQITTVPIRYKPILFIGRYLFRIWFQDLNGNWVGGDGYFREFLFRVEEQPDLEPPRIEILVNGEILTDGATFNEQTQFEIQITDEYGIDPKTVQLAFGPEIELLTPLPPNQYDFEFDAAQPTQAQITFAPDLPNDDYQIQVLAVDTSENASDEQIYRFRVDEAVEITNVLNVPNPMRTNTFFTYNLVQLPDEIMIKIYTVTGRLVRTILDASARRHYNETFWDGRDENGVRLANGTYFYRIIAETENGRLKKTGKLAILR